MSRIALAALLAAALPLGANAQGRAHDLERGLVAAYPLDGDAVDVVTRTRPVAQAVRPADGHDGQRGGALQFDGIRAYLNLGDRIDAPRFTIAAWIRPDAIDRPQAIVSKVRNLPGHWQKNFELRLDPGGRLYLQLPSGAAWDGVAGARPLPPGRWAHVAAVYDGRRAQLFVDGVRDGAPLEVAYAQTRTETFVGARPEGGGRDGRVQSGPTFFFTGAIEDVRIYDRPLSDAELQAVVAWRSDPRPLPPEPPPVAAQPPPPPAPGSQVIASYPLDGDAQDGTGRADGTVVGARRAEDRFGDKGGALAFTGREYVDLGARGAPERFTIAAWIRPARVTRELVIFSKWTGAPGGRDGWLELRLDPGGRLVLAAPGGGPRGQGLRSDGKVAPNRWTHVAASFDGDRAVLYVDGEVDADGTLEPFDAPRGPVFLGARPDANGRPRRGTGFDGRLDEVTLWRGAAPDDAIALAARDREPRGRRGDPEQLVLVKVDRMIARYDVACVRRDPAVLDREEESVLTELDEVARRDRDAAPTVRRASGELQALRGRTDAMSLDRKRTALHQLSEALWNDAARDLDADTRDDRRERRDGRDAGWF